MDTPRMDEDWLDFPFGLVIYLTLTSRILGQGYGIKCDAIENSGKTMVVWLPQLTSVRTLSRAHGINCGLIWNHFGNLWELGNIFGNIIWNLLKNHYKLGEHIGSTEGEGGFQGLLWVHHFRIRVHMSILRTTEFSTQRAGYEFIS